MPQKQKNKTSLQVKARHHAKRLLVPHKGNHYRPHLVRMHGITAVLVLAMAAQLIYGYVSTGRVEVLGRVSNIAVSELLTDTNEEREAEGLSGLRLNDQLNQAAFMKAQDMLANNYWAHTSPSGITPWKWLADTGYNYNVAGENLAKNYPTADATVEAWMASPTHKANILDNRYQDVGFAVVDGMVNGRDATLIVAYYGAPASTAVEGASEQTPILNAPAVSAGVGNPLAYFGSALQSLSPATLGGLALLAVVGIVGVIAHHYRKKLPASWRRSWKLHHGMYTFGGMLLLGVVIVFATGGGQI